MVARAGLPLAPRTSCTVITCDSALTRVTTLFGPLPMVTLSNTSSGLPGARTINLKLSSFGSLASTISTLMASPDDPLSSALTANGALSPSRGGQLAGGDRLIRVAVGVVGADAHDVGHAATVEEVGVHGHGEVRALDEATEVRHELGPVGDERRGVDGAVLGEADECGDGGADSLDRLRAGGHLLDVDTG